MGLIVSGLEKLPGGKQKSKKTKKQISVMRNFISFREYPKNAMMKHFYVYKQVLLKEAVLLVQKGLIREPEDIYYLSSMNEKRLSARTSWITASSQNERRITRSLKN